MEFGLNLFSIRNLLNTEEEFSNALLKLREMGYSFVQYSGVKIPFNGDTVSRVSAETGMQVVLTHMPKDRIINETESLMEEHSRFDCKNIGLGCMGTQVIADEKACKETIEKLNTAAKKMADNGFSFFYHNHHFEFIKYGGETVIDYMIKNAPYINFTLDTYWVQFGGACVAEYVEKLKGRIECVHLKDYLVNSENGYAPRFAPCGDGNINFKTLIPHMLENGVKYFIVEQDNAADLPDTLEQVKRSINYLKGEF